MSETQTLEHVTPPLPDSTSTEAKAAPAKPAAPPLFCIDEYRVVGELGSGSFGVVYLAEDPTVNRLVAIKKLRVGPKADIDDLIRFRGEAETLGSIPHPNIVQIFNTGTHEGAPYLVMEYVDGGSLARQQVGEPRPPRQAAELVETLARAIHLAHEKGIIHRDLKPANILLSKSGTPKITDFGVAKRLDSSLQLTRTGAAVGTPSYMSPEQARGDKEVGPAADVYALGAILYEMLTGRPPFLGHDVYEVMSQVRNAEPLSPSRLVPKLPRDLSTICLKCLEKLPNRRYGSALDLAADLRRYLDGHEIIARPAPALEKAWRTLRRHPLPAAIVALSLALIGMLAWTMVQHYARLHKAEVARLEEATRVAEKRLVEGEYRQSLEALNDILKLVREGGDLHKQPAAGPLHKTLLSYYERLIERQEGNALAPRDQLADACCKLGALIKETGNLDDALKAMNKAILLYEKMLRESPANAKAQRGLGVALLERARQHDDMGNDKEAREDFKKSLKLLSALHQADETSDTNRRDLSATLHWFAVFCAREDRPNLQEARRYYEQALALRRQIERPEDWPAADQRDLARTYGYFGDLLLEEGDVPGADEKYWESHKLRERLVGESNEANLSEEKHQLARSWSNFAGLQMRLRAHRTAIEFMKRALELRLAVVAANSAVSEYCRDLGDGNNSIAELLLLGAPRDEQLREAEKHLEAARKLYETEYGKNKDAVSNNTGLGVTLSLRARLRLLQGRTNEARKDLVEAHSKLKEVLKQRSKADSTQYQLAAVVAMLAEVEPTPSPEAGVPHIEEELRKAFQLGFRRLHPRDIEQDRAFRACGKGSKFRALLKLDS